MPTERKWNVLGLGSMHEVRNKEKINKYKFVGKITINKRLKFKASSTAYNFALPFVTARS